MIIVDQNGHEHQTHEIMFSGNVVKCVPENDKRKSENLGTYESCMRAAQIQMNIHQAYKEGKIEYVTPRE